PQACGREDQRARRERERRAGRLRHDRVGSAVRFRSGGEGARGLGPNMADVVPVRALSYDQKRAGPLDALIAPPYDVVSEADRAALAAKSPYNIVRVDLPQGDPEQKYASAARELRRWVDEGILRRDAAPAYYRYHQVFSLGGREHTRRGFVCRIRLRR